jgi:acetyl esterase/lipase
MKHIYLVFSLVFLNAVNAQYLVSVNLESSYDVNNVQSALSSYGWNYANLDLNPVDRYSISYNTIDVHGNPTIASGAFFIPNKPNCDYAPITVYEHGTEFVESNVPSTGAYYNQGIYFSTTGYIAVLPDYLGLGTNPGIHPYHHAESEATATIDLIRAVREFLDTANVIQDNGQVFLTGYSHGGHSAMATHKYIQEQGLQQEFNVVASAPLSGAYALNGAQYDLIFDGDSTYYAAPFLPYLLGGMQEVYGGLYQSFSDVYDAPYDANIQSLLSNGNSTFYQWYVGIGGDNYYNFMQDSVLNNMFADVNRNTHPINVALLKNNVYNWVPNNPVRMCYCGSDSMVSPNNSIFTLDTMVALGANDVQALNLNPNADHNGCFQPATTYALAWFDSLAQKCIYTDIQVDDINNHKNVEIYPNPANNQLTIKGVDWQQSTIKIYSVLGVNEDVKRTYNNIDIHHLKNGTYFILIFDNQNNILDKIRFVKM